MCKLCDNIMQFVIPEIRNKMGRPITQITHPTFSMPDYHCPRCKRLYNFSGVNGGTAGWAKWAILEHNNPNQSHTAAYKEAYRNRYMATRQAQVGRPRGSKNKNRKSVISGEEDSEWIIPAATVVNDIATTVVNE